MSRKLGIDVIASDNIEHVVKNADILVRATPTYHPLIRGEWIDKGTRIT